MKKEINKRSELILEIKNAYDSITDEMISNLIESSQVDFNNELKMKEIGFHINFKIYYIFSLSLFVPIFLIILYTGNLNKIKRTNL